jgi:serine/threonine protein kinase
VFNRRDFKFCQERAPELLLDGAESVPTVKSDIWSLGATIIQFLFDQGVWDIYSLTKQFNVRNPNEAVKQVSVRNLAAQINSPVQNKRDFKKW